MPIARPSFATRPDLVDPSGDLAGWFTDPPGVVVQLTRRTRATLAHAEWLVGPARAELQRRFSRGEQLTLVLDLSQMTERDIAARRLLIERASDLSNSLRCTYVIPPEAIHRFLVMSIHAAAALLRSLGKQLEIRDSFTRVRDELKLRHAPTSA